MRLPLKTVLLDALLAAVLTGLSLATLAGQTRGPFDWVAAVLVVLSVAPIAVRQLAPVTTLVVIVAALAGYSLLGFGDFPNGGLGLVVGLFTVATLRPRWVTGLLFGAAVGVTWLTYLRAGDAVVWSQLVQAALIMAGAWALGESTRRWAQRVEQSATRTAEAVSAERVRIARELHDIVAHHMSVISLQAGVAEYVLDEDQPTARSAIATVGVASREALLEMRRLLDVLRVEDVFGDALRPQPGLAQLDELAQRMRAAGLPVTVETTGPVRTLPPGPDLCAYRVAQESLTNVLKHAGPATARVTLEYGGQSLTLSVTDDGAKGRPVAPSPTAHGIRGMRERAELYGGVLTAGPAPRRGFAVTLHLPLDA